MATMTDATATQPRHLPEQNYRLAPLTPDARARVFPHLRPASLPPSLDLLAVAREMREHGRNAIWVASDLLRGEKPVP